jgi:hypothetical protein
MVDASLKQGGYEPGGASGHRLFGILKRSEKRKVAANRERKRIARWRDASSIALDADPSALVILAPCKKPPSSAPQFL